MIRLFTITFLLLNVIIQTGYGQCLFLPQKQLKMSPIIGIGNTRFYGDLMHENKSLINDLAFSGGMQYRFSKRLSLRGEIVNYWISGSDESASRESGRLQRNLSFRANNWEWNSVMMFDFFPVKNYHSRPFMNPYAFTGIGITYFQPKAFYQGQWHALRPLQTEGVSYGLFAPVIPVGVGIRIKTSRNSNLLVEGGYRFALTDYLDDVSTVYPDASIFNNPVAAALSDRSAEAGFRSKVAGEKRGNPSVDDAYFIGSIKMEFLITAKSKTKTLNHNKNRRRR